MFHPRAKKSLGQNFLIDPNYQRKIIAAVKKGYQNEPVIEVGPGKGALSDLLCEFAQELILIEKDKALSESLKDRYQDKSHVHVIHKDFLKIDLEGFCGKQKDFIVAGNLPYNVSSQILIGIFQKNQYFKKLFFMFQKEVALRCLGQAGSKDYGILSLWCQLFSKPSKLFDLPPTVFSPRPKVVSSFVKFDLIECSYDKEKRFIEFVKKVFGQRRKKVSSVIKKWRKEGVVTDELAQLIDQRPEQLSLNELKKIHTTISV